MSRRNDAFLTLCLSQAEISPLHYRHGSIIVRGGKVIGQGFNMYRPGFDGSALKTGILPASALDGPAIAELKQRLKNKPKSKAKPGHQEHQQDSGSFTLFEVSGGGHNANTPLSMHSEVMAIRSALSLSPGTLSSQTSARAAAYHQKTCFRLPGDSQTRKSRARALQTYAVAVCMSSEITTDGEKVIYNVLKHNEINTFHDGEEDLEEKAVNEKKGVLKHQKEKNIKYTKQYGHYQTHYHGDLSRPYQHKRVSEPHVKSTVKSIRAPDVALTCSSEDLLRMSNLKPKTPKKIPPILPSSQQLLITKNKTTTCKADVTARTKDLRLKGSDLSVARLGSCNTTLSTSSVYKPPSAPPPKPLPISEPNSLHDELSALSRTPSPPTVPIDKPTKQPEIRASRPCYRCVSAMHAVGIKRVFWTNADGEWEGAKVRDLVDAFEGWDGEPGHDDDGKKGVFVTKHEVLLLKRIMGF